MNRYQVKMHVTVAISAESPEQAEEGLVKLAESAMVVDSIGRPAFVHKDLSVKAKVVRTQKMPF